IANSLRTAGDKLNEDIIQFAQDEYKLLIGERTAESLKIGIGSAYPLKEKKEMPLRGRNLVSGLPEEIMVPDSEIRKAMERSVRQIVQEIKAAVEQTPPELLADIMASGIHLSGGGALLRGLDTLITKETKIPTTIVEDPLTAMVRGAGLVLENLDELQEVLIETDELDPPT
ncbi:rod shape-determining protein, partial [Patescibacteria group bacterium]|nr:rod shape-determining protein [Patescibacteria group bacterium]